MARFIALILILTSFEIETYCQKWLTGSSIIQSTTNGLLGYGLKDSNNDYYVSFRATGPINISPYTYSGQGLVDTYIAKYRGNTILWFLNIGSTLTTDDAMYMTLDKNENLIITGLIGNTAMLFKVNGNIDPISILPGINGGSANLFISKFSKQDGHVIKANLITDNYAGAVVSYFSNLVSSGDTVYCSGIVKGNTVFGSSSYNFVDYNAFVLKINSDFTINRQVFFGTKAPQDKITSTSLYQNNLIITGAIYNTFTFYDSNGTTVETNSPLSQNDYFIYSLDRNLNGKWYIRSKNGALAESINQSTIDENGNIYAVGGNVNTTFNTQSIISGSKVDVQIKNKGASGTSDGILVKYNPVGKYMYHKVIGGTKSEDIKSVFYKNGKVFISGYFTDSLRIGKDSLKTSINTNQDIYYAALDTVGNEIGTTYIPGTQNEAEVKIINSDNLTNNYLFCRVPSSTSITLDATTYTYSANNNGINNYLIANACPIIGLFETTTATTNIYVDPSKPQTGAIELDIKGDVLGGYSYQWSKKGINFSKSSYITNLGPDTTYTVKVDYLGSKCSKTRSFTVLRSLKEKSTAFTPSTSCAAKDGTITVVVTNNTNGKYTVIEASIDSTNWLTGTQSGNDYTFKFIGLKKGNYQLYYRLTVGASTYHTLVGSKIFIDETGNPITWNSTTVTPIHCNGDKGSITVSASGGTLSYSVTTSSTPNYLAQNSYPNLAAGTYIINITDGTCQYRAAAVNLTNPAPLTISDANISTCFSGSTRGISVKAEGGTAPYQYQLSDGTTTTSFQTSNVFSGLTGTSYTITVKDVNGCIYTTPAIDLASTPIIGISLSTIVSHYYSSIIPGEIIIVPEGGTNSAFTYSITPTGYTQNQSNFENLQPNTYSVTILHNAGCTYSELFEIKDLNQTNPLVYRKQN